MDTEKTNSISEARAALGQIYTDIPAHPIGSPARDTLENAAIVLESVIWKLMNEDVRQITPDLRQHQQKLQKLSNEMEDANTSLEKTNAVISKVSRVLDILLNLV